MKPWLHRHAMSVAFLIMGVGFTVVLTLQFNIVQQNRHNLKRLIAQDHETRMRECHSQQHLWDVFYKDITTTFTPIAVKPSYGPELVRYITDRNLVLVQRKETFLAFLGPKPTLDNGGCLDHQGKG